MNDSADLGVIFPSAHRRGGVERIALEVCERFSATRKVDFIGREYLPEQESRVRLRLVQGTAFGRPDRPSGFRDQAADVLRSGRPDTVLSFGVNCPPGDVYWVQSVHQAWLRSGSTVRVRGVAVPSAARRLLPRHRELLRLEHQYFTQNAPRAILCTSQREVEDLNSLYGVPPARMHVVPNGFDSQRFHVRDRLRRRAVMRLELGIREEQLSLLFVVNELHRKGFSVLLEAVALVQDPRLRIDIVGRTSPDAYQGQIARLGLTQRVHWHGPTSQVEDYMMAGDLLVLPTQYEPFGLVIVEALACGLPVITTALAGAAPAVVDGVGLLQSDPHDAVELAALLQQALEPGQLDAWGLAAPLAAAPYEWAEVLRVAEPLIFN